MSAITTKFNVGGTVFEVAVSTIQSQPEGLLAKMIDGRFPCGKDKRGAYFVDLNPRFFDIVLDVHRDNKVYALAPGVTRERALAELEFYGLQDVEGASIDISSEAMLRSVGDVTSEFCKWQQAQKKLANKMLVEGFARLLLAEAEVIRDPRSTTLLRSSALEFSCLPETPHGAICANYSSGVASEIVKLCAQWNIKATVSSESTAVTVAGKIFKDASILMEPAGPVATSGGA